LELEDDPVVPAPAGYSLVTVLVDEPPVACEEPIIAFSAGKSALVPYTLEGLAELHGYQAIKGPDGKVTAPCDQAWDSVGEFVDHCVKKAKEARERAAAKKGAGA
jgi:hypothetical protein